MFHKPFYVKLKLWQFPKHKPGGKNVTSNQSCSYSISAGLAIALQGPITNLAGWPFILWRRPLDVGDLIQIGDYAGDVINIRIFQFTLLEIGNWVDADQSIGRIIHIPNGDVFSKSLASYEALQHREPVIIADTHGDTSQARTFRAWSGEQAAVKAGAVVAALMFILINVRGSSETGLVGNIITIFKLIVLGLLVLFGLRAMLNIPNWANNFLRDPSPISNAPSGRPARLGSWMGGPFCGKRGLF